MKLARVARVARGRREGQRRGEALFERVFKRVRVALASLSDIVQWNWAIRRDLERGRDGDDDIRRLGAVMRR
jgi:hypothetical protein